MGAGCFAVSPQGTVCELAAGHEFRGGGQHIDAHQQAWMARESVPEAAVWSLVFTDPSQPPGEGFRGAVLIRAAGYLEALHEAHRLGCAPPGDARGVPLPLDVPIAPEMMAPRILTREECLRVGDELLRKQVDKMVGEVYQTLRKQHWRALQTAAQGSSPGTVPVCMSLASRGLLRQEGFGHYGLTDLGRAVLTRRAENVARNLADQAKNKTQK